MPEVTIIGCGVSGLSSAVLLQTAGFNVKIIAREEPQFTTSFAAGAVWYGGGALGKAREWAEITLEHFQALAEQPNTGVQIVRLREVFPHSYHIPWYYDLLPYFEQIPKKRPATRP
jgi:D-amino-acid oxidase